MGDHSKCDDGIAELRKLVGTTLPPSIMEIERGAIRRYANAVGDPNPIYGDAEFARNTKYGELICLPGFFGWPVKGEDGISQVMQHLQSFLHKAGVPRVVNGGEEYEFYLPIRANDILVSFTEFVDVQEKEGKTGKLVFITYERTFINQNGARVAKARVTLIGTQV